MFNDMMKNPTESVIIGDSKRYEDIVSDNKNNQKLPTFKEKADFEDTEYDAKPKSRIASKKHVSNANSDSEG